MLMQVLMSARLGSPGPGARLNEPSVRGTTGERAVRCRWVWLVRLSRGNAIRSVVPEGHGPGRGAVYGRAGPVPSGAAVAQGSSESGRVPPSVGSHGTPVSIGPLMPPS